MKTALPIALAVLPLLACGPTKGTQADGGRDRQVCTTELVFMVV